MTTCEVPTKAMKSLYASLLAAVALISSGAVSIVSADPAIIGIELNDDVVCIGCPPAWELKITYRISDTCTQVDTYTTPCEQGCSYTFVGSTSSGSCGSSTLPVATEVESPECPECPETEVIVVISYPGGCTEMWRVRTVCDPAPACYTEVTLLWASLDCYWTESAKRDHGAEAAPSALLMSLSPARPNPTRLATTLRYVLPRDGFARLALYDAAGRTVRRLADGQLPAGEHIATWDLRDASGRAVAPGVYFARLEADGRVLTRAVSVTR